MLFRLLLTALWAVCERVDGERLGHGPGGEPELVAVAVDLRDADPRQQHLHLHPLDAGDRPRPDAAGDAATVPDVHAAGAEAAVAGEVHLEGAVGPEDVPRHALGQDARREVVALQHLVRRRLRRRLLRRGSQSGVGGHGESGEAKNSDGYQEGEMVRGGHGFL